MVKKIIDVPEDALYVEVWRRNENDESNAISDYVDVESLKDAPEKRVIELPADNIRLIEQIKNKSEVKDVIDFINEFPYEDMNWDILVDWYLGHVKFVAKKDKMFVVEVMINKSQAYIRSENDEIVEFYVHQEDATKFTEAEADELVAGLTTLKAVKVPVDAD